MIGIIGGGFGLYGYLPAVLEINETACLLSRFRQNFQNRIELSAFTHRVKWVSSLDQLLEEVDVLIICVVPQEQIRIAKLAILKPNIKTIILEKPIAPTPKEADDLIQSLYIAKKNFRVNYSFLFLPWAQKLCSLIKTNHVNFELVKLTWRFNAHYNIRNLKSWKSENELGGGVIRFYAIHLIALAAGLELTNLVSKPQLSPDYQSLSFVVSNGIFQMQVEVNCNSSRGDIFKIVGFKKESEWVILEQKSPFDEIDQDNIASNLDKRVPILKKLLDESLFNPIDENTYQFYKRANLLWRQIEVA